MPHAGIVLVGGSVDDDTFFKIRLEERVCLRKMNVLLLLESTGQQIEIRLGDFRNCIGANVDVELKVLNQSEEEGLLRFLAIALGYADSQELTRDVFFEAV